MNNKKLTLLALIISLGMILSYIESQIILPIPIPGIKVGLANIAVIFTLYKLGIKEAILVSIIRIIILSILFGNLVSLIYSLVGAILSLLSMTILRKTNQFSIVGVSIIGGVMHNVGQIIIASIMLETNVLTYYLPYLLIGGIGAGIVIGLIGAILIKRIKLKY